MDVIVVEDDDMVFEDMRSAFSEAGIMDLTRATHGREAMILVKEFEKKAVWIVDGIFPMYAWEGLRKMWPDIIFRIRRRRKDMNETIIGFSQDPEIFKGDTSTRPDYILDKASFSQSAATMVKVILGLSNKQGTE